MDFGINANFNIGSNPTHAAAFQEAFEEIDLAEELGLDTVWLGEMHFNPNRSVLSAPIIVATGIATRTKKLRVGMAVQVLPLIHPLRIAEETATVDQLSEGRFELGVGRSGNVRAYDIMGIDYGESRERFQEALDIILQAWSGETFSYEGKFNTITNATLSPVPYQQPHPKIRIAASSDDSFARIGRLGQPIFLGLRTMDVEDLKTNLEDYKSEWKAAGHPVTAATSTCASQCTSLPATPRPLRNPRRASRHSSAASGSCSSIPWAAPASRRPSGAENATKGWPAPPTRTCCRPGWCSEARSASSTALPSSRKCWASPGSPPS